MIELQVKRHLDKNYNKITKDNSTSLIKYLKKKSKDMDLSNNLQSEINKLGRNTPLQQVKSVVRKLDNNLSTSIVGKSIKEGNSVLASVYKKDALKTLSKNASKQLRDKLKYADDLANMQKEINKIKKSDSRLADMPNALQLKTKYDNVSVKDFLNYGIKNLMKTELLEQSEKVMKLNEIIDKIYRKNNVRLVKDIDKLKASLVTLSKEQLDKLEMGLLKDLNENPSDSQIWSDIDDEVGFNAQRLEKAKSFVKKVKKGESLW